jgi:hypothetical protein
MAKAGRLTTLFLPAMKNGAGFVFFVDLFKTEVCLI